MEAGPPPAERGGKRSIILSTVAMIHRHEPLTKRKFRGACPALRQLPGWHPCLSRQLLSLTQIHLPQGQLLQLRSPAQLEPVSRWSCGRSGVRMPSLSTQGCCALPAPWDLTVPSPQSVLGPHPIWLPQEDPQTTPAWVFFTSPRSPFNGASTLFAGAASFQTFNTAPGLTPQPLMGLSPAHLPGWTTPWCCSVWSRRRHPRPTEFTSAF